MMREERATWRKRADCGSRGRRWNAPALTILFLVASALPASAAAEPGRSPEELVKMLASDSADEVSSAFQSLVDLEDGALPALKQCLSDPRARLACVEVLVQAPAALASPVLVDALQKADASGDDDYYTAFVVGAVGRAKSTAAVPTLESMRQRRASSGDIVDLGVAWALTSITGTSYEPAADPWSQGKSPAVAAP